MIVPDHWAEARKQHRQGKKQITVRRFGWSILSEADALAMAESRVDEALARILAGEKLNRRERKTAYNGAFGVPIREEVLARHGEEVITRNSYGAHCLNSPRALFADVDFNSPLNGRWTFTVLAFLWVASVMAGAYFQRWSVALSALVLSFLFSVPIATLLRKGHMGIQGGPERVARKQLQQFLAQHPAWNLRVYKTPNGLRLLATHQVFDATSKEVQEFFEAVGTDPIYQRMCVNQRCFRARLTAKPWRIGIPSHMRPRPGLWPVHPDRLLLRTQWVAEYERLASGFAACRFVESLGSGEVHDELRGVVELHDRESRAELSTLVVA